MEDKVSHPVSAIGQTTGGEPAVDNLRIVVHVVERVRRSLPVAIPMEYLTSIGLLGLSHAELSYRAGKPISSTSPSDISFQCYAKTFIRGFILDSLRFTSRSTLDLMQLAIQLSRIHDQDLNSRDNPPSKTLPADKAADQPARS